MLLFYGSSVEPWGNNITDLCFTSQNMTGDFSSSYGGEYEVQTCPLMMEAARTSQTSVDNYFTRQYIPEDKSEQDRKRVLSE
jgi:hypothetical protein